MLQLSSNQIASIIEPHNSTTVQLSAFKLYDDHFNLIHEDGERVQTLLEPEGPSISKFKL